MSAGSLGDFLPPPPLALFASQINNFFHFIFFTGSTSVQTLSQPLHIWPGWSSSPPSVCRLFYLDSSLLLRIIALVSQPCGAHCCEGSNRGGILES